MTFDRSLEFHRLSARSRLVRSLGAAARRLVALGLLALTACDAGRPPASSAPADTTAGELPFELAGPAGAAIVVPAYIDGKGPFELILDTGATLTCVDSSLARELALPSRRAVVGAAVAVGGTGGVRIVRIDSLRVGASRVEDLPACVLDLTGFRAIREEVRGLLGLNYLRRFRVTLDFDRRVLRLTQPVAADQAR